MATVSGSCCTRCHGDSQAKSWCIDCRTFLCSNCEIQHRKNKASKRHDIISIQTYLELPDFVKTIQTQCKEHTKSLEKYCSVHEQVCCVKCASKYHKRCPDLRPLSEVLSRVKSSASMSHIEEELKTLLQNHEQILKHLSQQKTSVNKQKNIQINKIRQIRASINLQLDKLEKNLIQNLDLEIQNQKIKYDKLENEIESKRKKVESIINDQAMIKTHATNLQTFIALDVFRQELKNETGFLRSIQTLPELYETFIDVRLSSTLDSSLIHCRLGDIYLTRSKDPVPIELIDTAQSPVPIQEPINKIRPHLLNVYNVCAGQKESYISGCSLLPNNDLVIADQNIPHVNYYDHQGILVKQINTKSEKPLDVCTIDDIIIAISPASYNEHHILFADTARNKVVKKVNLGKGYKYVSFIDNLLVVGINSTKTKEIVRLNQDGKVLNRFKTHVLGGVFASNNMIYYTECTEGSVVCSDELGSIQWTHKSPSIRWPCGIAVDNRGFIFVTCRDTNSIVVISQDGQHSRVILNQSQGLEKPLAIAIEPQSNKLIVCNRGENVFLYQL